MIAAATHGENDLKNQQYTGGGGGSRTRIEPCIPVPSSAVSRTTLGFPGGSLSPNASGGTPADNSATPGVAEALEELARVEARLRGPERLTRATRNRLANRLARMIESMKGVS